MRLSFEQFKKAVSISGIKLIYDRHGAPYCGNRFGSIPVPLVYETLSYAVRDFPLEVAKLEKDMEKDAVILRRMYENYLDNYGRN